GAGKPAPNQQHSKSRDSSKTMLKFDTGVSKAVEAGARPSTLSLATDGISPRGGDADADKVNKGSNVFLQERRKSVLDFDFPIFDDEEHGLNLHLDGAAEPWFASLEPNTEAYADEITPLPVDANYTRTNTTTGGSVVNTAPTKEAMGAPKTSMTTPRNNASFHPSHYHHHKPSPLQIPRHDSSTSTMSMTPRKLQDGRKRKHTREYNKVLSTIKSNRAKQANVQVCAHTPKKDQRQKGVVYIIHGESKRWDGRQWRRLCVVENCHSAARGATDFCICHGKGELKQAVIGDEVVEVLALDKEAVASATAVAPATDVISAVKAAGVEKHIPGINEILQRRSMGSKRKSAEVFPSNALGGHRDKMMKRSNSSPQVGAHVKRCTFITENGEHCNNFATQEGHSFCNNCWTYVQGPAFDPIQF
ncbi:tRNA-specific adenosine deaminase 1, partial [Durusdinium trenchii]